MLSRRQFLARSGAAGAAVLAPQALLPDLASARKAPLLGSGKFAEGIAPGDPAPHGVTLWTRIADLERKGAVRLEVARDKGFRRVIASKRIGTGRTRAAASRRASPGCARTSSTSTASRPRRPQRGRPLPYRAAGGLQPAADVRVLLVPGLDARLLQLARSDGRRGSRFRRLSRRLHLRRDLPHARRRNRCTRRHDRLARLRPTSR